MLASLFPAGPQARAFALLALGILLSRGIAHPFHFRGRNALSTPSPHPPPGYLLALLGEEGLGSSPKDCKTLFSLEICCGFWSAFLAFFDTWCPCLWLIFQNCCMAWRSCKWLLCCVLSWAPCFQIEGSVLTFQPGISWNGSYCMQINKTNSVRIWWANCAGAGLGRWDWALHK